MVIHQILMLAFNRHSIGLFAFTKFHHTQTFKLQSKVFLDLYPKILDHIDFIEFHFLIQYFIPNHFILFF